MYSGLKKEARSGEQVLEVAAVRNDMIATSIARGLAIKKVNAVTAGLCGALPAILLGILQPVSVRNWMVGFIAGLLWANGFEYVYHRFLLHLPKTFFAQRHLEQRAAGDCSRRESDVLAAAAMNQKKQ